jgi:starch-binding outer membrane protein SusE/F
MKMKNYILYILSGMLIFSACDDETGPVINETAIPPDITFPAPGSAIVLTKELAESTTAFTWSPADYGVPLGVLYTLQVAKAGNDFTNPVDVVSLNSTGDTLTYADFNSKMVALEATMESENQIEARVMAFVPNSDLDTLFSEPVALTVTPYTAKDNIYLVGQHNGWNNATAPVMNRSLPGLKYELYLNLTAVDQGFKILPVLGSWDGDIGDDPGNPGQLIAEGEQNMTVPSAGFWRIDVDLQAMTWSATRVNWSLIGDFNNWSGDVPMTYDPAGNVLTATVNFPAAGGFKFRANADWALNYGDTGADGILDAGGDNIMVSQAGSHTITLNLNPTGNPHAYTYTVTRN